MEENRKNQPAKNFRDLKIWLLGKAIALEVYKFTKKFPKEEIYGLTSQMRRACISIPSNIAEGFNRFHNAEYRQFLFIAYGSCAELETQLEISLELGYIGSSEKQNLIAKLDLEQRMIRSLIKKL